MKLFLKFKIWLVGILTLSIQNELDFLELTHGKGDPGPLIILSDEGAEKIKGWEEIKHNRYFKSIGETRLTHYDTTAIYRAEENET